MSKGASLGPANWDQPLGASDATSLGNTNILSA